MHVPYASCALAPIQTEASATAGTFRMTNQGPTFLAPPRSALTRAFLQSYPHQHFCIKQGIMSADSTSLRPTAIVVLAALTLSNHPLPFEPIHLGLYRGANYGVCRRLPGAPP